MDEAQDMSGQEKDNLAGDVMESLGEPKEDDNESESNHESSGQENTNDPLYVQKRLKQQKRAHDREMRALRSQIDAMQSGNHTNQPEQTPTMNHYEPPQGDNIAEHVSKAVSWALQAKEREEGKARDAERQARVHKQYQELNKHLDNFADKYDDFDDVVRGEDAPFTHHIRDAALLLPMKGAGSAGEVLYKLGQNKSELERIAKLHPLDQAREVLALSHALVNGGEGKNALSSNKPLGNIKSNPVSNSTAITDKTSTSEIRARMKEGRFK